MRHTKITAFITFTAISAFLLFLSSPPLARAGGLKQAPTGPGSITATFLGIGGEAFQPGQSLGIKWVLEGDGVRFFEADPWAECELFFSSDNGRNWLRISPHMSVTRRSFEWIVPNVTTSVGMIALQIGIEGDGDFFTFRSPSFKILPGSR